MKTKFTELLVEAGKIQKDIFRAFVISNGCAQNQVLKLVMAYIGGTLTVALAILKTHAKAGVTYEEILLQMQEGVNALFLDMKDTYTVK